MSDAQSALAQVCEALEAMRGDWLGDGFTKLHRSQIVAVLDGQAAEIERLTANIKKANDQAEYFERHWYLRGDEIERLRAALVAAMEYVQAERVVQRLAVGMGARDTGAVARLDAIIAQADAALGTERG